MGLRGPPRTPTRILELRGSRRADRNPAEPRPPAARPPAPGWLIGDARKAYLSLSGHLHAVGVLSAIDQNALVRYVTLWVRYRQCEEFLAKHGDTYVLRAKPGYGQTQGAALGFKLYPQARHALLLADQLLRLEREFGLTPAGRARLTSEVPITVESSKASYFSHG